MSQHIVYMIYELDYGNSRVIWNPYEKKINLCNLRIIIDFYTLI
jgi:hypothetical protein